MASEAETVKALYQYSPSKPGAIIFAVLYSASFLLHEQQYRLSRPQKFTIPLTLGAAFSALGFIFRSLNALHVKPSHVFWRASTMLILGAGPTYAGGDYFVCGRVFSYVRSAAPISPLRTVRTFLVFDVLAEVAIWAGAGSMDRSQDSKVGATIGLNLVRVAVTIQLALFVCFLGVIAAFQVRATSQGLWKKRGEDGKRPGWVKVVYTLYASSVLIIIRSAYHITETFLPLDHPFIRQEAAFLCLEALVMLLNIGVFNLYHPGFLLPRNPQVYLLPNGCEAEDESSEGTLHDSRSLLQKITDPLDIRGLFSKNKKTKIGRDRDSEAQQGGYEMVDDRI